MILSLPVIVVVLLLLVLSFDTRAENTSAV